MSDMMQGLLIALGLLLGFNYGNPLNYIQRYRQWRGGKWGRINRPVWGKQWIKLHPGAEQYGEIWGAFKTEGRQ